MSQNKILINRTQNCIELLKQKLQKDEENCLFNDLLILRHIVPTLPNDVLKELLHTLKPFLNHEPQIIDQFNFDQINTILLKVERPSPLLIDFLACAGIPNGGGTYDF